MLRRLQEVTGVRLQDIPLNDKRVLSLFCSPDALGVTAEQILFKTGTVGLFDDHRNAAKEILEFLQPTGIEQIVKVIGLLGGLFVWWDNAREPVKKDLIAPDDCPATREDIFERLIKSGIDRKTAYGIIKSIHTSKGLTEEMRIRMREAGIPESYTEICKKIKYMIPREQAVTSALYVIRLAWFKLMYPQAFYRVWLEQHRDAWSEEDLKMDIKELRRDILAIRQPMITGYGNDESAEDLYEDKDEVALLILLEMRERGIAISQM